MLRRSIVRPRRPLPIVPVVLASFLCATGAGAQPTLGFIERWSATTSGWSGGSVAHTNPLAGGFENDGYLRLSLAINGNLGTHSNGAEYTGDWLAAGITRVTVRLNDLAQDDPLTIHFLIGQPFVNVWQHDAGLVPPVDAWAEYVIDLTDSASFTRTIGSGSFAGALQGVQVVHLRHDLAPYVQTPDPVSGDLGIDHLMLTNATASVPSGGPGVVRPIELAAPSPNPSRGPVALTLRVSDDSPIQVRVLDAQGRAVRSERLAGGAGVRVWLWDGRDDAGRAVAAGIYRAVATSRAGGTSRSLVRVN